MLCVKVFFILVAEICLYVYTYEANKEMQSTTLFFLTSGDHFCRLQTH